MIGSLLIGGASKYSQTNTPPKFSYFCLIEKIVFKAMLKKLKIFYPKPLKD